MEKCKKKYILNSYYLKNTKNFQTFFWISTTYFKFYFFHLQSVCINLGCDIQFEKKKLGQNGFELTPFFSFYSYLNI